MYTYIQFREFIFIVLWEFVYVQLHEFVSAQFQEVVDLVLQRGWDVSRLIQVVRRYCIAACEEIQDNGQTSRELFDVILQGEIFPGV